MAVQEKMYYGRGKKTMGDTNWNRLTENLTLPVCEGIHPV